jgi:hypothetical protein
VVEGDRGRVRIMTVLVWSAVVNSVRPGLTAGVGMPFRSAIKTVMPRALVMFATRFPGGERLV